MNTEEPVPEATPTPSSKEKLTPSALGFQRTDSADETPFVSILLPVRNGADFLQEAIDSVLRQSYEHIELIVRDDASTDATWNVASQYLDPRIKLHRNPTPLGQFGNFNACILDAEGDFIQFFAHDDVLEVDCLKVALERFESQPDAGLCYWAARSIDESGVPTGDDPPDDATPEILPPELYLRFAALHGALPVAVSGVMVHRSALEFSGPFDPTYTVAGDLELWNRIGLKSKVLHVREPMLRVRRHPGQVTSGIDTGLKYILEEARIWDGLRPMFTSREWRHIVRYRSWTRGSVLFRHILREVIRGRLSMLFVGLKTLLAHFDLLPMIIGALSRRYATQKALLVIQLPWPS